MPLIGIVTRESRSSEGHLINYVYTDIIKAINYNGGDCIGITLDQNYKSLIDLCDGIIFSGGDDFELYDLEALKYIYDINKPVLGICLGMQLMGILFESDMINIANHKKKLYYSHEVKIKRNSLLYNIYKKNIIKVNSRHKSVILNPKIFISAYSNDNYIEAIEDKSKKFFLGVQWHPESMIKYDKLQNNIFKYFVKSCTNML